MRCYVKIKIFTVGGTIDKVYFDQKSTYQVGKPQVKKILEIAGVAFDYEIEQIIRKDSLDMNSKDRQKVFDRIKNCEQDKVLITHGTDTMVQTAKKLNTIKAKTIVLTGSMQPARFRDSDAIFNIGSAVGALVSSKPGTYIVMNGRRFDPETVRKNVEKGVFEKIS
ncbi:MAG: asparaginase domain-containing protein [Candidatus Marinimicrobia bacterium]|nr:asparaginase domain-containing protein [Candidatus Neomarinimicrobiota bacterium]